MTMNMGSGQTSVTGSVEVTQTNGIAIPTSNQTALTIKNVCNGSGQTAYTVTSGKTFYLYAIAFCGGAGQAVTIYKNDASTKQLVAQTPSATSFVSVSQIVPISIYTSAQNVVVNGTNGVELFLYGVEQ